LTWLNNSLARQKKLPPLKKFLGEIFTKPNKPVSTREFASRINAIFKRKEPK
jgi:hypothetical protein